MPPRRRLAPGEFLTDAVVELTAGLGCLLTYSTAVRIDPGLSGHITLEFSNGARLPIKL
jgi:hypothetical protein